VVGNLQFDDDAIDAAREELDARYAAQRENACVRNVRRAQSALREGDMDAFIATAAPGFVFEDRRRGLQVEFEGSDPLEVYDGGQRFTFGAEVIATRGDHLALMRITSASIDSGFTGSALGLYEANEAGLGVANIIFDDDDLAAAVHQLDERHAASLENAAVRNFRQGMEALQRADMDALQRLAAPSYVMDDRRKGLGVAYEGGELLRAYDDGSNATFECELVATRGDHFALHRSRQTMVDTGFETSTLVITVVDDQGESVLNVMFDEPELAAAVQELDALYATHRQEHPHI